MVYSRSLLALVLVVVLVLIRGKSRTHRQKEKKRTNRPTNLISRLTRPCLGLWICTTYGVSIGFYCVTFPINRHTFVIRSTHSGLPFASTGTGPPFAQASIDTAGLYELGYRHAPLCLSFLPIGSSGSVPPFSAIPITLGVGDPGQQHACPVSLLPHNGQQLLVELPLYGAVVGGERKREGVATTVTDIRLIHHIDRGLVPALPGLRGWLGFMMFRGIRLVLLLTHRLKQKYDTSPSQLSRDGNGEGNGDKPGNG